MIPAGRWWAAGLCAAAVTGFVLLRFPPEQYSFYPRCPVYETLHWKCPGCGATRALAALLHGQAVEALHWNALFTILLPFFTGHGLLWGVRRARGSRQSLQPRPAVVYGMSAAALLFMVLRNLPGASF